jgi:ferritin-like metal-binding protein YciE
MASPWDVFVEGLRAAHTMEAAARVLLERQLECLGSYPEFKTRLAEHLKETAAQLMRLEDCLEECGIPAPEGGAAPEPFAEHMIALAEALASEDMLKTAFAHSALQHFKIAAYKTLLILCPEEMDETRSRLEASLQEDERIAAWIDANLGRITLAYIAQEQAA